MVTRQILKSRKQSVKEILRLASKYKNDLGEIVKLSIIDFFNKIKMIPYKMDKKPIEIVKRPDFILKDNMADCKKKTVLCVAYFLKKNIKFRLIGTSIRKDKAIHHIFPQIFINGNWKNYDTTYPKNKIFSIKYVTNYEILWS